MRIGVQYRVATGSRIGIVIGFGIGSRIELGTEIGIGIESLMMPVVGSLIFALLLYVSFLRGVG
jgi:hypothetical protein